MANTQHCGVMVNHAAHQFEGRANPFRTATMFCPGTQHSGESSLLHDLSERREDREFRRRLTERITKDRPMLDRMADGALPLAIGQIALGQLESLPLLMFVGANRYDTDDSHVLHLWTEAGESFDVIWPKVTADV